MPAGREDQWGQFLIDGAGIVRWANIECGTEGQDAGGVEDLHPHGIDVHAHLLAVGLAGRGVVGAVDRHRAVLLHRAGLAPLSGIRDRRERDEAGLLFGVGLVDAPPGRAVDADIGDGVQPLAPLRAQVIPRRERAAAQVEGDTPSRRTFVFDDAARADVQAYFRDEPVGGRSFASSLKMLKSAVHAGR